MGLYINTGMVKARLVGKIRFTDDAEREPDKMSNKLLHELILQAEGEVEFDMSPRYSAPFQTKEGTAFKCLPDRPTKQIIRNLCILRAVMNCLQTDFGRGSATKGENYYDGVKKQYESLLEKQIEKVEKSYNTFLYPPLLGLRLNYQNENADTGFKGRILVAGDSLDETVAIEQVNNPVRSFWNPDPRDFADWTEEPTS